MLSRTSFFNPGLFRKNMLRFWPVWASYAATWLLGFGGAWPALTRYSRLSGLASAVTGAERSGDSLPIQRNSSKISAIRSPSHKGRR